MVWNDMQWYSYSLPFLLLNDMQEYVLHSHTLPFLLMQWYARICLHSHTLPFLLMQTFWMDTHSWIRIGGRCIERIRIGGICIGGIRLRFLLMHSFWMDTHWLDTHRMETYWWDTCWRKRYWWDTYWWDTFWMDMCAKPADANLLNGYALNGYVLVGYVLNGYVLVGYVLNGYVWEMCGVMDMCGICVVWDTPTIFWRTLRRNVFREKPSPRLPNGFPSAVRWTAKLKKHMCASLGLDHVPKKKTRLVMRIVNNPKIFETITCSQVPFCSPCSLLVLLSEIFKNSLIFKITTDIPSR